MSLATTYDGKLRVINDILSKMSPDEKRIVLQSLIKEDMKTYFEVIWDEQKRLETEAGIEGVCEFTSDKAWADGKEVGKNQTEHSEDCSFQNEKWAESTGLEVNLAGKPSKEAENAYYFDEKPAKNDKNDRFDGFLGYVNSSGNEDTFEKSEVQFDVQTEENEGDLAIENGQTESTFKENEAKTTLEPGEFIDKIADKIEELEMKNKMINMKFPDFGGEK